MEIRPFRPKGPHLSEFLAREMLLDYFDRRLEPEREQAVEEWLKKSGGLRSEFEGIQRAQEYCRLLSELDIKPEFKREILKGTKPSRWIIFKYLNWKRWPSFLRWGFEAFLVSALVSLGALMIPWDKLAGLIPQSESSLVANQERSDKTKPNSEPIATRGFYYEAQLTPPDSEPQWIRRVESLLKAHRAKTEALDDSVAARTGGRHFHFSILESNYEELLTGLRSFGPVQITKIPDVRLMPPGEIRIILWVKDPSP